MGMFDYVRVPITCKRCGTQKLDGQTKDAECCLRTYEVRDGFLFSKEYDLDGNTEFEEDNYSGHMDVWLHCCGAQMMVRLVFVRGKLVYRSDRNLKE